MRLRLASLACLLLAAALQARAQRPDTLAGPDALDVRALRAVYSADSPAFRAWMGAIDATSYPAFVALPAGLALQAAVTDGAYRPAVRVLAAEGAAGAFVLVAKRLVGRPRPYETVGGIRARIRGARIHGPGRRSYSLPSGHAALAFAGATSLSLSHPRGYVAVPAYVWATSVALARVWEGVHYPSDVLAGAAVGAATGVLVHLLLPDDEGGPGAAMLVTIRVSL